MNSTHAPRAHASRERGMATAEYAVGVLGAACIGCIVAKMGADSWTGWITDILDRLRDLGIWMNLRKARL